jgi:hypothetical protein
MPTFDEIMRDHRALHVLLDRARALSRAPLEALPKQRWLSVLDHEVRSLTTALERHFALEERGGYLREVTQRRPRFERQIHDLAAQHAVFRGQLGGLARGLSTAPDVGAAQAQLDQLLSELEAHEHAENELLQAAASVELGAGD